MARQIGYGTRITKIQYAAEYIWGARASLRGGLLFIHIHTYFCKEINYSVFLGLLLYPFSVCHLLIVYINHTPVIPMTILFQQSKMYVTPPYLPHDTLSLATMTKKTRHA